MKTAQMMSLYLRPLEGGTKSLFSFQGELLTPQHQRRLLAMVSAVSRQGGLCVVLRVDDESTELWCDEWAEALDNVRVSPFEVRYLPGRTGGSGLRSRDA